MSPRITLTSFSPCLMTSCLVEVFLSMPSSLFSKSRVSSSEVKSLQYVLKVSIMFSPSWLTSICLSPVMYFLSYNLSMMSARVAFVPSSLFSSSLIKEAWLYLAGGLVSFSSDMISKTLIKSPSEMSGNSSLSIFL